MKETFRSMWRLLDPAFRRKLLATILPAVLLSMMEVVGIGLVLPFVQVLSDKNAIQSNSMFSRLYDLTNATDADNFILILSIAIFVLLISKTVLAVGLTYWQLGMITRAEARMAGRLHRLYMSSSYLAHIQKNTADMAYNVRFGAEMFYFNVVESFTVLCSEGVTITLIVTALVILQPAIALLMVAFFVALGFAYFAVVSRWAHQLGKDARDADMAVQRGTFGSLAGFKTIRVLGREEHFITDLQRTHWRWAKLRRKQRFASQIPRTYLETALVLSIMIVSLVTVAQRQTNADALGALALFVAAGLRVMPSLNRVFVAISSLKVGRVGTEELAKEVDRLTRIVEPMPSLDGVEPLPLRTALHIDKVSFCYPNTDRPALHNVEIVVPQGSSVGIVGSSGAGKTTLLDMLLGLLPPSAGKITADDVELRPQTWPAWRAAIGYVPQDIYLVDDTLRNNIALGVAEEKIDEDALAEAVRKAQLSDLVNDLPDGLQTMVGERGVRLSGGQRQRVGIARALYRRPHVLILDEATSALDTETESRISSTIQGLRGDITLVVVAHRLSTVRECDRIYFMKGGRVDASGTFEELRSSNDEFATLVRLASVEAISL